MECCKQQADLVRWVGAILISALVAEGRNCLHGFFSSSGTGCGIRGIAWAGLHDDAPEKGLTLSASCRGRTVSCPAHPCVGRKVFPNYSVGGTEVRSSGARSTPSFSNPFPPFFCPVEQGSHGFGNAHVQPVADPGIRYQRALPDGQGDDELGRVAVRRDKQLLLREAEGLQTVFTIISAWYSPISDARMPVVTGFLRARRGSSPTSLARKALEP